VKRRFEALRPFLNEKQRRLLAGVEAETYGEGGIALMTRTTGLSDMTVRRGMHELEHPESIEPERVRRKGAGAKRKVDTDPTLRSDLEKLVDPATRGEPDSPLRWTSKSTRKLADELCRLGHQVSPFLVADLLHQMGYNLMANRKTNEGSHPDRDEQFQHISAAVQTFQQEGQPVISCDTKKKELIGEFKNGGKEWQPEGKPERVNMHDFADPELGKAAPYGVYDVTRNDAWVSVGTDHDTAAFAVQTIRSWWQSMGREAYPNAHKLLITADGGGSNGYRVRLWKLQLQRLADETGLAISVCHFPPGTSKWNKIEHRLFAHITQNWRARPLTSHEAIVNLIANTTTRTGLKVQCQLDPNTYPTGVRVTDQELDEIRITGDEFHPNWNYTISPGPPN